MPAPATPRTLADLSPAWLTHALRDGGALADGAVTAAGVSRIGEGQGFLSTVARVTLTYDRPRPDAPASVVVKLEPDAGALRDMGDALHAFEREVRFYREVAPGAPIRLARLYFASLEPPDFAIVMEDLCFARPGDQVAGLHAREVIETARVMGRLQGRYWHNARLDALDWMPRTNAAGGDFDAMWPSFVQNCGEWVDPAGLALGERLLGRTAWLEDAMAHRPHTVVHSDLRADNLLFGAPGTPEAVLIVDWQLAVRGLGAFDVARIMGGSELPAERHGHQLDVLRAWHEAVVESGATGYGWEETLDDLRLGALAALCYPVHFHRGVMDAQGRARDVVAVICRRLFDSAVEMDAGAVLG